MGIRCYQFNYKSDGILINAEFLDGGVGGKFRFEKVASDEYDYVVRKNEFTIF
jgi:hypothetical protein